jgi:hypothetical protein
MSSMSPRRSVVSVRGGVVRWIVTSCVTTAIAWSTIGESSAQTGSVVQISGSPAAGYELLVNGKQFVIRGVGGTTGIPLLAQSGGNAIRTWDAASAIGEGASPSLLDDAANHGVYVTVGLWLGHERHGFRYDDPEQVQRQRRDVERAVRQAKDHPALLCWGLGNEMEGPGGAGDNPMIWREVNALAEQIKALDTNHPVMTVVANVNPAKVAAIKKHAPLIDILGVNVYAGAAGIDQAVRACGWDKPYCVTEYGLPGPWEVGVTEWSAPLEPSSREKGSTYYATTSAILDAATGTTERTDPIYCLGGHAFLWGQKQEVTATWFSMFLPSGEKTLAVDAVSKAWTGNWPANRAPVLKSVAVPVAGRKVAPASRFELHIQYADPDGDPLTFQWNVLRESTDRKVGGDAEKAPPTVKGCLEVGANAERALLTCPREAGAYRLVVTVRDGKGSGCSDNWPFFVAP